MKRNNLVLVVVIIVVIVMVISAKRLHRNSAGGAGLRGDAVGSLAPDFTLKTLDGQKVKLSDYRGKAVVLNFWATWCGPCRAEIPWLIDLQKQYGPKGVVILGVAMDDDGKKSVAPFVREMGMDYPVLLGNEDVADEYGGVDGLPTTFYVDRNGRIVKRVAGLISHGEIEDNIRAALASTNTSAALR